MDEPIANEQTEQMNSNLSFLRENSGLMDLVQSIVIAIVICIIMYVFIATPNQIEGASMENNFHNGEIVLTSKVNEWLGTTSIGKSLDLDYKRGDVIVFQKPGFNDFIKRVIGLPGEKVAIRDGHIYINGEKLVEDYLDPSVYTNGGTFIVDGGEEKTVPENYYFAVGDNRNNSHDSRYADIGFISRDWVKGKVLLRYWPLNVLGVIQTGKYELTKN